jgi:hypothetical protein
MFLTKKLGTFVPEANLRTNSEPQSEPSRDLSALSAQRTVSLHRPPDGYELATAVAANQPQRVIPTLRFAEFPDFLFPKIKALSADEVARDLLSFTRKQGVDRSWLADFVALGLELGNINEVNCVYENDIMDKILSHPEKYRTLSDLLEETGKHSDELTSTLTFGQKLKYGGRLKRFGAYLEQEQAFFDALTLRLASLLQIPAGQAAVGVFAFFFREDLLDSHIGAALNAYVAKL